MKTAVYQEALDAFANPLHEFTVEQLNTGLINQSYKVTSRLNGKTFLLQKINQDVFTEPAFLEHNYEMLWKYLQAEKIPFVIPEPKYFPDNVPLYCDSHNQYWRVFEFMDKGYSVKIAKKPSQAKAVAQTFGSFTASFEDFDLPTLYVIIPGFHNLSQRFKQLQQSIHRGHYDRLIKGSSIVEELKHRERYASFYDVLTESEQFRKRVIHHDAKISNILFDTDNQNVICPVDFDTAMPGYFFSDLGDMIRSMACNKDENCTQYDQIAIQGDFYEAIVEGYLSVMEHQLTDAEKKYIHYSGLMMTYMQALRFLSDYLGGDVYYHIDYGEQNFDRAKNQFTLLQKLEAFLLGNYNFKI